MERLGRELSASQLDFIKIQHRNNELAAVGKKRKRSTEEDAEFKKLQRKLDNSRRDIEDFNVRLLFKCLQSQMLKRRQRGKRSGHRR